MWLQFAMREYEESSWPSINASSFQKAASAIGKTLSARQVECETSGSLRSLLARRLVNGAWDAAEGWMQDDMVYRVERRLAEHNGSRNSFNGPVLVAE